MSKNKYMLCCVLRASLPQAKITVIVMSLKVPRIINSLMPFDGCMCLSLERSQLTDIVISDSGRETKRNGGMKEGKKFTAKRFHIQDII